MRYVTLGALGGVALAMCGGSALAQTVSTPQALYNDSVSRADRGPVSNLYLTLQETYDSNVAETDAALAAARGLKVSDEIFTPSVSLNIVVPEGLTQFFAGGNAGYQFYSHDHSLNQALIGVFGGATTRFLCQDTVMGDFEDSRHDDVIAPVRGISNAQATGGVTLRATCGNNYGLSPTASVGERWSSNSTEYFAAADYRMFTANVGLNYQRPKFGNLGIYGALDDVSFERDYVDLAGNSFKNGYNLFSTGVKYSHIGQILEASASVGYTYLTSDLNGVPDFNGLSYTLDLHYHPGNLIAANLTLTRSTVPSDLPNATFMESDTYGGGVSYFVNHRIRLGLSGQISHDDYRGAALFSAFTVANQTIYSGLVSADCTLTPHLIFRLSAGEVRRDTDTPGYSYTATVISAKISAKFGN